MQPFKRPPRRLLLLLSGSARGRDPRERRDARGCHFLGRGGAALEGEEQFLAAQGACRLSLARMRALECVACLTPIWVLLPLSLFFLNSISPAYDKIWYTLVKLADVMGDQNLAIVCLEKAILANHYSPHLFEEMDLRLACLGQPTLRDKFARKAAQLRQQGILSSTYIEVS